MNKFAKAKEYGIKISFLILLILVITFFIYFSRIQNSLSDDIVATNTEIMKTNEVLGQKISDIETILLATQEENTTLAEALDEAKKKTKSLEKQFDDVSDDVEDLETITKTDPELLQKYSKVYFLNEHYVPSDLKTIPDEYTYNGNRKYEVSDEVWPYLRKLLEAAEEDGMNLQIISAYRSFAEQAQLKGSYTVIYGAGTANQFSADQGYSEHQLGTTVDFTNPSVGSSFSGFSRTEEYKWLQDNAHKFGFVLSYPENNAYYEFEPWHWRFVGEKLADDLHDDNEFFYDLSQRDIDEYILYLFD